MYIKAHDFFPLKFSTRKYKFNETFFKKAALVSVCFLMRLIHQSSLTYFGDSNFRKYLVCVRVIGRRRKNYNSSMKSSSSLTNFTQEACQKFLSVSCRIITVSRRHIVTVSIAFKIISLVFL